MFQSLLSHLHKLQNAHLPVLGTLTTWGFFFGVLFDNLSLLVSMVTLGLYTNLPDQAVQILGAMPFLVSRSMRLSCNSIFHTFTSPPFSIHS